MCRKLYVCNNYSDSISIIDTLSLKEIKKIKLNTDNKRKGPEGICLYKENILVANNYSNSLSFFNLNNYKMQQEFFIGAYCSDVKVCNNNAYIICRDSNSIVKFNIIEEEISEIAPCENMPRRIDIYKPKRIIVTANMLSDSITILKIEDFNFIKNIRVGSYPTKAVFGVDGNNIFVCESNIGADSCGSIAIFSLKDLKVLYRVPVGKTPVDMYIEKNMCYVSNFGDGTISIVDLNKCIEIKRIEIGGMPECLMKDKGRIYVGDNYNNIIICVDLKNNKKTILMKKEPSAMVLS